MCNHHHSYNRTTNKGAHSSYENHSHQIDNMITITTRTTKQAGLYCINKSRKFINPSYKLKRFSVSQSTAQLDNAELGNGQKYSTS